jgi:hypothetical protein
MSDLSKLARPWDEKDVKAPAQGKFGDYVPHYITNQRALLLCGPFSFEIIQTIRGKDNQVEGCIAKLTATIDGHEVVISEVGDCEQPGNWKTEGARLKDAASDAFKRCWMRTGLGLHLYVRQEKGERYFLFDALTKLDTGAAASTTDVPVRDSLEAGGTTAPVLQSRGVR